MKIYSSSSIRIIIYLIIEESKEGKHVSSMFSLF